MLETLLTGFIGGVFAWFFTDFVTKPLRRFFDLRREANRCLVRYGNVPARARLLDDYTRKQIEISPEEDARLTEAQNAFRDLGADMRAFANVEIANRIVRYLGYDADEIASALIGYSNQILAYGIQRKNAHDQVERLLGIRAEAALRATSRSRLSFWPFRRERP